jgi:hypothetical protein
LTTNPTPGAWTATDRPPGLGVTLTRAATDVTLPTVTGRRAAVREEEVPTDEQLDEIRQAMPERY